MKRFFLFLILFFTFIFLFSYEIKVEKKRFDCLTNSPLKEPLILNLYVEDKDSIKEEDFLVVFEKVYGDISVEKESLNFVDGKVTVYPKVGKKMGANILRANIFYKGYQVDKFDFKVVGLNWLEIIVTLLGGLGLFLFGMKFMSDSLQNFAGERMKYFITKMTKNTFMGVLTGSLVTSFIQSSSATTVIVVGLVNAGIMTLTQSIGIIMGANIGTTMTAQLIAFKLESLSLPAISIGVLMILFGSRKIKITGETILGFGLLFYGLGLMSSSIAPLKESDKLVEFMTKFNNSPILSMLTGMLITIVIQSSSATVGLTMVLAVQGLISINSAVPLILGENIGTTITALLASLSSNINGKRAAITHALFNLIGVSYMMLGIYFVKINGVPLYYKFLELITPGNNLSGENVQRYIANSHTIFNVFNTILFLPFAKVLENISKFLIREKKDTKDNFFIPKYLDRNLLLNPHLALYNVKKEMMEMIDVASNSIELATKTLVEKDFDNIEQIKKLEMKTDILQNEITNYLILISKEDLSDQEFAQIPVFIHCINDIERIGDHSINIIEFATFIRDNRIELTEKAYDEIKSMNEILQKMMREAYFAIEDLSVDRVNEIFILEDKLNDFEKRYNRSHLLRISDRLCSNESAAIFTDILTSYERCGDHIANIAEAIKNKFQWSKYD
ncbi:MAG: Na/Pi cotransporter family protein [bacterium]|nr:Na/Pi cotransporter family protein [bacterium]